MLRRLRMGGPLRTQAHRGGAGRRDDWRHRGRNAAGSYSARGCCAATNSGADNVPPSQFVRMHLTLIERRCTDRRRLPAHAVIRISAPGCELSVTITVPLPVSKVVLA